jgi:hypothetical protein
MEKRVMVHDREVCDRYDHKPQVGKKAVAWCCLNDVRDHYDYKQLQTDRPLL